MARILEALKQGGGGRSRSPEEMAASGRGAARREPGPEIPFIEVGGGGVIVEASPGLLAQPEKTRPRRTPPAPSPAAILPLPRETPPAEGAPVTLSFQALANATPPARNRFARELVAFHDPECALAGQYQSLADQLLGAGAAHEPRVLLFTAAASGPSKTTVLLNLAITCVRRQARRVVVVDAGAGSAPVAQRLGLAATPGLRDVLRGKATLPAALQGSGLPDLHVLTAGEADRMWPSGEPARVVLRQLRQSFDLVLVDAPAWDGGPDGVALATGCDTVLLVLRQAEAQTPEVEALLQAIPRSGARLGGCVLTTP